MRRLLAAVSALALAAPLSAALGLVQAFAWAGMAAKGQSDPCAYCLRVSDAARAPRSTLSAAPRADAPSIQATAAPFVAAVPLVSFPPSSFRRAAGRWSDAPPTPPPDLRG